MQGLMMKKLNERDRLSSLPDEILVKILSNLPTIDSVRTCLLSKRWVSLWTHITSLHFDLPNYDCGFEKDKIECFQIFLSMVLSCLTSPTIDSYFISTRGGDADLSSFLTWYWYTALAKKSLKSVTIYDDIDFINTLPSIFSCQTLVHLKLVSESVFRVPNFIHLPNLQTLDFSQIQFTSEDQDNNVILRFPILKKLISNETCWTGMNNVKFEVPLLQVLQITEPYETPDNSIIVSYNITSNPFVSITFADIKDSDSEEDIMEWGLRACFFLKQLNINQVKHLELLSAKIFKFVRESFADLPTFNILRHLKLGEVCEEILIEFLVKSPYLTSLIIKMKEYCTYSFLSGTVSMPDHAKKLLEYGIVPDCISDTLKFFKIECFGGHVEELNLAKYIMKNAHHLETISFSASVQLQRSSSMHKDEIKEKLLSYKRGLNLTTINFFGF